MNRSQVELVRRTTRGMQWMLLVASGLVFIVGIQLYVFTEQTDRFFAWTIKSPLTAAFLGAGYWASLAMELLASRQQTWARARIAVPAVLLFTTLTLIVTFLHLDKFHLTSPDLVTRAAAWAWLIVYAVVPLVMAVLLVVQLRSEGTDPPRHRPLPPWCHGMLIGHALIMIPSGLALLLAQDVSRSLWPWVLTPLTAQAIGVWLLSLGVAAAHSSWENDWQRVQVATLSYTVFGGLQLLALLRYGSEVAWERPGAWFYLVFLLSVLALGLYGWWESRQTIDVSGKPVAPARV